MQQAQIIRNRPACSHKIEGLRAAYASIERIDPDGEAYKGLCRFLDDRTDLELQELADAQIKWVSTLALNRCIRRGIPAAPNKQAV